MPAGFKEPAGIGPLTWRKHPYSAHVVCVAFDHEAALLQSFEVNGKGSDLVATLTLDGILQTFQEHQNPVYKIQDTAKLFSLSSQQKFLFAINSLKQTTSGAKQSIRPTVSLWV